jgi:hypothetical protein
MTEAEARALLASWPPERRTRAWLEGDIRYGEAPGLHTRSLCPCGRQSRRGGCRCVLCLRELMPYADPDPEPVA